MKGISNYLGVYCDSFLDSITGNSKSVYGQELQQESNDVCQSSLALYLAAEEIVAVTEGKRS